MEVGVILLAAGSSSRMGQSKQLLKVREVPLLVHSASIALESGMHPVVVVLGANEREHRKALEHLAVHIAININWENGIGGSLKTGLKYLLKHAPKTAGVIVMVCDQPMLTVGHLVNMKAKYTASHKRIVASNYSGTTGVPALFNKTLFSEILDLSDDQGAKKIIQQHPDDALTIEFPEGSVDLDTPEDYKRFIP